MPMINCQDCGKDISDSAASCPNCGKPVPKKSKAKGCLFMLALLVGGYLLIVMLSSGNKSPSIGRSSQPQATPSVNFSDIEKSVRDLTDTGFIKKMDIELNEAWVSRALWDRASYDQKQTLGYVLAQYCGFKKGNNLYHVTLKDHMTGKELASWSKSWGFKIKD